MTPLGMRKPHIRVFKLDTGRVMVYVLVRPSRGSPLLIRNAGLGRTLRDALANARLDWVYGVTYGNV